MIHKHALAVMLTASSLSGPCFAGDDDEPRGLLYLKVPLGVKSAQERQPTFGFMIRAEPHPWAGQANPLRPSPVMDISFRGDGGRSFSFFGLETYRLKAAEDSSASASPPGEVNWLLLGGAAVAVAVLANQGKSSSRQQVCTTSVPPICN